MKPAALAALALVLAFAGAARAQPQTEAAFAATTVSLSAVGETKAAPDTATLSLGVTAEAPTAAEALRQNSARMNQVIAALRRGGVAETDLRTQGLAVQAQYAFTQGQPQRLTGYQASNQVTVTVGEVAKLGPLLDAAVAAGANQVNGVSFGLQNPGPIEDQARLEAVRTLKARAELYAQASGYRVVRLVSLAEGGGYLPSPPRPVPVAAMAKMATPVEAGALDVRVEVTAVYELGR